MKYVSTYERFLEKNKYENSFEFVLENLLRITEAEEKEQASSIAPTEAQSDKEIIEELPEEDKKRIEELIKKHAPEAKGKEVDLDNIPAPKEEMKKGEEKVEESAVNEGLLLTAVALIPIALEAIGSISNWFKRNFNINLSEEQIAELGKINDAISVLKELRNHSKQNISYGVKCNSTGIEYNTKTWFRLLNDLSKKINNPEIAYGKGHGHGHGEHESETKSILSKVGDEIFNKAHSSTEIKMPDPTEDFTNITVGKAAPYITIEINKLKSIRDKKFGTNFGNFFKKLGHKIHSLYTLPIRAVLYGLSGFGLVGPLKKEETRIKVANVIYAFMMLGIAGFGIVDALKTMSGVAEVSSIILKGWESQAQMASLREESIKTLIA
jgi:hypothetical protein